MPKEGFKFITTDIANLIVITLLFSKPFRSQADNLLIRNNSWKPNGQKEQKLSTLSYGNCFRKCSENYKIELTLVIDKIDKFLLYIHNWQDKK